MPWQSRVEQLQLANTEYVQSVEDNLIFHERDEEGNPVPPEGTEPPPPDTTEGGLAQQEGYEEETEEQRLERERLEDNPDARA